MHRFMAVLGAVALVATACGGGDDAAGAGGDEATAESPAEPSASEATTDGESPSGSESSAEESSAEVATDVGVTAEPCPDAVNPDNGCIYLGILSDLTEGPFASLGPSIVEAQERFWERVNADGGIGGRYDVDVSEFTRDNKYNPEVQAQVYTEIEPNILAIAQTLGSPPTAAILDQLRSDQVVAVPASWTSLWELTDIILEAGAPYCIESMNAIDYYAEEVGEPSSVVAIGYPGDFGEDGAAGAKVAAEAYGADFTFVEQVPKGAGGTTDGAVETLVSIDPDVVIVTTGPTEMAEIVSTAAARGYDGRFIGTSPTWTPSLLESGAAAALTEQYWQSAPWEGVAGTSEGHEAMRAAFEGEDLNPGFAQGWGWSYPMLALLEKAHELGDLTRAGVTAAVGELEQVDFEGFLPPESADYTGDADNQTGRFSIIATPDAEVPGGVRTIAEPFAGDTARAYELTDACYRAVDLG